MKGSGYFTSVRIIVSSLGVIIFVITLYFSSKADQANNSLLANLFLDLAAAGITFILFTLAVDYLMHKDKAKTTFNSNQIAMNELEFEFESILRSIGALFGVNAFKINVKEDGKIIIKDPVRHDLDELTERIGTNDGSARFDNIDNYLNRSKIVNYTKFIEAKQQRLDEILYLYERVLDDRTIDLVITVRGKLYKYNELHVKKYNKLGEFSETDVNFIGTGAKFLFDFLKEDYFEKFHIKSKKIEYIPSKRGWKEKIKHELYRNWDIFPKI